jgi:GT2 family glycosyltransferase
MTPPPERKKGTPYVSVIIVNCDGRDYLQACLAALRGQSYVDFETIVVDNGSRDGSADFVEQNYGDWVRLIRLPENRGYAGGNNAGIHAAKGTCIALLNNDTVVDSEWLDQLVRCVMSEEKIGMVGSKILNDDRREEIDNTGHLIYPDGLNRGRGRLEIDCGQYDGKTDILFPSGCAALYRKKMLDEIGGFDETFFAYGDDTDIGLHGRCLGYQARYCPTAVVYHKYSKTAGAYSVTKAFYVERNRLWILHTYFSRRAILLSPIYTGLRILFQGYGILIGRGAAARFVEQTSLMISVKTFLKAYFAAYRGLPRIWEKRKRIRRQMVLREQELSSLLSSHSISCREIALKD